MESHVVRALTTALVLKAQVLLPTLHTGNFFAEA